MGCIGFFVGFIASVAFMLYNKTGLVAASILGLVYGCILAFLVELCIFLGVMAYRGWFGLEAGSFLCDCLSFSSPPLQPVSNLLEWPVKVIRKKNSIFKDYSNNLFIGESPNPSVSIVASHFN
jgi:hypothetical protein